MTSAPCASSVSTAAGKIKTSASAVTALLPDGTTRTINRKEQLARLEHAHGRLVLTLQHSDGTTTTTTSRQAHNSALPPAPAGVNRLAWERFGHQGTVAAGALTAAGLQRGVANAVLGAVATSADPLAAAALAAAVLAAAPQGADMAWAGAIARLFGL